MSYKVVAYEVNHAHTTQSHTERCNNYVDPQRHTWSCSNKGPGLTARPPVMVANYRVGSVDYLYI